MKKKAPATTPDQAASQDLATVLQNAKIPEKHQMSLNEAMTIYDLFNDEAASNDRFCRMNAAYTLGFMRGVDSGKATINAEATPGVPDIEGSKAGAQEKSSEIERQCISEALNYFEDSSAELERARRGMNIYFDLSSRETLPFERSEDRSFEQEKFIEQRLELHALSALIANQLEVVDTALQRGFDMFYACMRAAREAQDRAE